MKFSIKEVSQIVNLPPHTLRYYEDCGFLVGIKRDASGHRIYSEQDLEKINLIKCLRVCGLSIGQLQHFFSISDLSSKEQQAYLQEYIQHLEEKQSDFVKAVHLLEKQMKFLSK